MLDPFLAPRPGDSESRRDPALEMSSGKEEAYLETEK